MTKTFLKCLIRDERGATAIELGLICGLIVIAMVGALQGFASESNLTWNTISAKVRAANNLN